MSIATTHYFSFASNYMQLHFPGIVTLLFSCFLVALYSFTLLQGTLSYDALKYIEPFFLDTSTISVYGNTIFLISSITTHVT
jgi:hypothetical protein